MDWRIIARYAMPRTMFVRISKTVLATVGMVILSSWFTYAKALNQIQMSNYRIIPMKRPCPNKRPPMFFFLKVAPIKCPLCTCG